LSPLTGRIQYGFFVLNITHSVYLVIFSIGITWIE